MKLWDSQEIFDILKNKIQKKFLIGNISIDSRSLEEGDLFIALRGEKFDGHDFVYEALKKGASAVIINKSKTKNYNDGFFKNKNLIPVNNTLIFLKRLAEKSRKRPKNLKTIAITGSSGKTSVKDWISFILSKGFKVHKNPGNFNNQIGLPLTLSRMKSDTEICILEIGMNKPGEISILSKIAKPHISIITNIGPAHIGNFKNIDGIVEEKASIINNSNLTLIPRDSKKFNLLKNHAIKKSKKYFTFGFSNQSDFQISEIKKLNDSENIVTFKLQDVQLNVKLKVQAKHWYINILILLSVIKLLRIKFSSFLKFLYNLAPQNGRGSIHHLIYKKKRITLFDDSYNSNPLSLKASLNSIKYLNKKNKRTVCIIGDMLELGKKTSKYHVEIIDSIVKSNADVVYTVGKYSKMINKNLPKSIESFHCNDLDVLYNYLRQNIIEGDFIMIKGSNSINLNSVCVKIKDNM